MENEKKLYICINDLYEVFKDRTLKNLGDYSLYSYGVDCIIECIKQCPKYEVDELQCRSFIDSKLEEQISTEYAEECAEHHIYDSFVEYLSEFNILNVTKEKTSLGDCLIGRLKIVDTHKEGDEIDLGKSEDNN